MQTTLNCGRIQNGRSQKLLVFSNFTLVCVISLLRFKDFVCLNIEMSFSPEAIKHKRGLHVVAEPARKADF